MNRNIIAAAILAVGLVTAAFLHSGRFYVLTVGDGVALKLTDGPVTRR
jgi:hypothetical protein